MKVIKYADLPKMIGEDLGSSPWITIDQDRINKFADVTGDHQWIHVDVDRAKREIGGTIAHGFLTLSLMAQMYQEATRIDGATKGINYGCNKMRFTGEVPAGSRVRMHQKLVGCEPKAGGLMLTRACSVEIEGKPKPAVIAEWVSLVYGA
jgi:acyl dehydratase